MNTFFAKSYDGFVQKIRGWDSRFAIEEMKENQYLSIEAARQQRLALLRNLLEYCNTNVPYYRSLWENIGFFTKDVTNETDIHTLPVISKDSLRDNYDAFLSEQSTSYDVWKSSGSTGEPFPFRLDKMSIAYNTFGSLMRGKDWWGFKNGEPEAMIWSGVSDVTGSFNGRMECLKRRFSWALKNVKLIDVYGLDLATIQKGYMVLLQHQPVMLRTIASGLYRFCVGLEELNLAGNKLGIKGAIYTGEGLSASQREFIESVLGCPTICEYGCTELGVIGFECPEGCIHLSHDNLLLEFLKDGHPANSGEIAELVVTNLRNYTSPLIRYSVGDFVVPSTTTCKCGITLPIIEQVQGRVHDTIVTPNGVVIHGLFFTHLFDKYDQVHQFRVVQEDIENLCIEIVALDKINNALVNDITVLVKEKFGDNVLIHVNQVKSLPTSARGKTPWIISKVEQDGT